MLALLGSVAWTTGLLTVAGLAVGVQPVASVTEAAVGPPGVVAPVAAHPGGLTLVLVVAGDLVVVQVVPPTTGAADPALLHLALVVAPTVVDGTRVNGQAPPSVLRQVVPVGGGLVLNPWCPVFLIAG